MQHCSILLRFGAFVAEYFGCVPPQHHLPDSADQQSYQHPFSSFHTPHELIYFTICTSTTSIFVEGTCFHSWTSPHRCILSLSQCAALVIFHQFQSPYIAVRWYSDMCFILLGQFRPICPFCHTANQQHNSKTRHIFTLFHNFSAQSCHQTKYAQSIQQIVGTPAQTQYSDSNMRAIVSNITTTIDSELRHPFHPNNPSQSSLSFSRHCIDICLLLPSPCYFDELLFHALSNTLSIISRRNTSVFDSLGR